MENVRGEFKEQLLLSKVGQQIMNNDALFSYVHPAQYQTLFRDIKRIDASRVAILRSIENEYSSLKRNAEGQKDKKKIKLRKYDEPEKEKSIKSDRSVRSIKTRHSFDDQNSENCFPSAQLACKTARSHSLFSRTASVTNFAAYEQNLKRPKYTDQEKIKRLYLAKVLASIKYNLVKAFRNFKAIPEHSNQKRKGNNRWTQRAVEAMAMNSKISLQKSLWRLKANACPTRANPNKESSVVAPIRRSFSQNINIIILPEQTVDYSSHHSALLSLVQIQRTYEIQSVIAKFHQNSKRCTIVSNYFRKLGQNLAQNALTCLRKLKLQAYMIQQQTHNYRKKRLEKFFNNLQLRKDRYVFGCFKMAWQTVQWKKDMKIKKMVRAWGKRAREALNKWKQWNNWKSLKGKQLIEKRLSKFVKIADNSVLRNAFERISYEGHNKWFRKAASRLALNCRIEVQNSLWRLEQNAVKCEISNDVR